MAAVMMDWVGSVLYVPVSSRKDEDSLILKLQTKYLLTTARWAHRGQAGTRVVGKPFHRKTGLQLRTSSGNQQSLSCGEKENIFGAQQEIAL